MPTAHIFNLVEGGLWLLIGAVLGFKSLTNGSPLRAIFGWLALAFLAFGFSDFVEARTGAWWRPLWLLCLKGGCIAVFFLGFGRYFRHVKAKTQLQKGSQPQNCDKPESAAKSRRFWFL